MEMRIAREGIEKLQVLNYEFNDKLSKIYYNNFNGRIFDKVKAASLRQPEFIGGEVDLRINIYRGQVDGNVASNNAKRVPDNAEKVPDNARKMPDSAEKVPDSEQEQQICKK